MGPRTSAASTLVAILLGGALVHAHNGPAFPIVSDRAAGNYVVSIWADPDVSVDGAADARFFVTARAAKSDMALPRDTRVKVAIWAVDRADSITSKDAALVAGEDARWATTFVLDREGRYGVRASVDGGLGAADVETVVDAMYDQRPRPMVIALFVLPFVLIGFVWLKLIWRRRQTVTST